MLSDPSGTPGPSARPGLLCLAHVADRVLVHGGDAREMPRLEGREGDGQVVAQLKPGEAAEVGEAFTFFLSHVIAVGQIHRCDRRVPPSTAGLVARDRGDRVPDVVMVMDRIECFLLRAVRAARAQARPQQRGIEDRLLRRCVQFKEHRQPVPHRAQSSRVGRVNLLQDREAPTLFVMVVEDQLGYVHGALLAPAANLRVCPCEGRRNVDRLDAQ